MVFGEIGVDEAMGGTGVDEGAYQLLNCVGEEVKLEGVRIGKSGRVEPENQDHARGVNAALALRGVRRAADYFFGSAPASGVFGVKTWAARAFAAEEDFLEQSDAVCPEPPQKRQRLFVNLR